MGLCQTTWLWLLVLVTATCANTARSEVAVQYHCAGGSQLAGDTHLTAFHKFLALRSSANLKNLALTRLSGLLTNSLRLANNPQSASLIKPLLNDVVEKESLGSFGEATASGPSFILAVHLEAPRAQWWQDNCAKILGGAGERFASREFSGRRWNTGRSNSLWMIPARDWLLVGCGDDFAPVQIEYLNQIKALGRPVPALTHNWLEADLSSARLGGWWRLLKPARISLAVTTKDDNLQIAARVVEAEAIPWKSEAWQIPKHLLRGQIISYSAGQNVAAFLNVNPAFSHFSNNPLTNQFYFWALDQMPLLNYMAWPAANASNDLERLSTEAPAALNADLKRFNGTQLAWIPKSGKLAWLNMRMFVPVMEAVRDQDGQFLFLYSFPSSATSKPAPDALLDQIAGRTNLVYYDWELTGRRLSEWKILRGMIANRAILQENAEADAFNENDWFSGLERLEGNTVTEITRIAPNELSIARKTPLGFTAMELVLLADWLSDANSGPIHSPPPAGSLAPPAFHP